MRINADTGVIAKAMEAAGLSSEIADRPLDPSTYPVFLDLLSVESSRNELLRLAAESRSLVSDYFRQEGLYDEGPCALVDIGWSRFCQHSVNVILGGTSVFGYFFGVFDERMSMAEAGDYAAMFYPEEFYNDMCNRNLVTQDFMPLLEQFFTLNDQQSTVGFTRTPDGIVPLFDPGKGADEKRLAYFRKHFSILRSFSTEYLPFLPLISHPELLVRNCGYRSVTILMNDPGKDEAGIFRDFMVDNGLGDPIPLVKKVGLGELFRKAMRSRPQTPEYIWTEGTVAYSFGGQGLDLLRIGRKMKATLKVR